MATLTAQDLFATADYSFEGTEAFHRLKRLAENPFDLTDENQMTQDRLKEMQVNACGLRLLYGTQRVTNEVLEALFDLAKEARLIEKMEAQQAGEVINRIEGFESENRKVLHTAMRDFFDHPNAGPAAHEAALLAKAEVDKLDDFIGEIDKENAYTDLIFIGIGGSELGPKMVYYALQDQRKSGRQVHFISNVDPDDAAQVLERVNLEKTLAVVVSKSGSTLETKTNEDLIRAAFEKAGLKAGERFLAVTGKGSPMDDPQRYKASFYMWDYVGGRYCAASMVGGIMLAFAFGMKVYREFLKGCHEMDLVALNPNPRENLPLMMALLGVWNRSFLGAPTVAIIPYSATLQRFTAHIQQLDMESNGKRIDRRGKDVDIHTGPIIWGEPATNAQHSFFQLIHQGTDIIPIEFIGFRESQFKIDIDVQGTTSREKLIANLFAQALALATGQKSANPNKTFPGNRPSSILLGRRLTPHFLGALLSAYEHKVDFQGYIWNINSFDQEGVQLGKVLANQILHRISCRNSGKEGEVYPLGDTLLDLLDSV